MKKILFFALPVIASNLLQQLYNAVDSIVIGRYAGSSALAAVGVSNPVMMLFNALFMGFSVGSSIVVAQTYGAKNMPRLRESINSIFSLAFVVGLIITVVGVLTCRSLFTLLNVPDNVIDDAVKYLTIIFTGTLGNVFFNYGSGIMRGLGDSRWPLVALAVSCVLNIVLDIWFVYGFGWGVAGVAWATVIGQTLSGFVLAWRINMFGHGLKISFREMLKPNKSIIMNVFRLGIPSGLQNMARSLGGVIVQSFTNSFGSIFIAANTAVLRLDGFVIMPMFGLGMSATTFVGQNTGAGNHERAKQGVSRILLLVLILSATMGVVMYFFGQYAVLAFTTEKDVLEIAVRGIRVVCFIYLFMGIEVTLGGAMRGAGSAVVPMYTTIIGSIIRIPLVYVMAIMPFNYMGVFYSMASSMIISSGIITVYYYFGKWRKKAVSAHISDDDQGSFDF